MRVLHLFDAAVLRRTEYRRRAFALLGALRAQGVQTVALAGPGATPQEDIDNGDAAGNDGPPWQVYRCAPLWNPAPASLPTPLEMPPGLQQCVSPVFRHGAAQLTPGNVSRLMSAAALAVRLRHLARLTRPDLVHVHTPSADAPAWHALAAIACCGRQSPPLVAEAERRHGRIGRAIARAPVPALERWALTSAGALAAPSLEMRAALRAGGVACRRIAIIAPASELAGMPRVPHRLPELEGAPLLAFAGRLERAGGSELLLTALHALRRRYPGLRLLLAGAGPGEDALAELIAAGASRGHALITGSLSARRTADVLARADIVVFPALAGRAEPLAPSRHLLNAMAQGCAIVASDVACHRELLVHGHTALLFQAGNVRALADTLLGLLESPARRGALGTAAARCVAARHSWEIAASGYRRLYDSVLADRKPKAS